MDMTAFWKERGRPGIAISHITTTTTTTADDYYVLQEGGLGREGRRRGNPAKGEVFSNRASLFQRERGGGAQGERAIPPPASFGLFFYNVFIVFIKVVRGLACGTYLAITAKERSSPPSTPEASPQE